MRLRSWLCLLTCVACSGGAGTPRDPGTVPPSKAADSTSISPDESGPIQWIAYLDSAEVTTGVLPLSGDTLADAGEERPRVVVRCEAGRLGAYLVMDGSLDADSAGLDDRAVPVTIDSPPRC
jgi:hypothetical protein